MNELDQRLTRYVPEIDGLRALAVLSVIAYHLDPAWLPGGFSGVDVFFVISGYVVSASLARRQPETFGGFALKFYARRILRIFPALVACLLVTVAFQVAFIPGSFMSDTADLTALYAFFGLSNFALIWFDDGYFSPAAELNPFTHTWSLAVEEQFYFIFPFLFFLWAMKRRTISWPMLGLALASLFYSAVQSQSAPSEAYYLLPSRFWELAAGALLFQAQATHGWFVGSARARDGVVLGGLALAMVGFLFADKTAFPFPWAIFAVLGMVLAILGVTSGVERGSAAGAILGNPVSIYIGKISYSLYLWHWPVIVLLRWTVGVEGVVEVLAAVVLTAALAIASYRWIETPFRSLNVRLGWPSWRLVASGLSVLVVCAAVTDFAHDKRHRLSLSVTTDHRVWHVDQSASGVQPGTPWSQRQLFVVGDSHAASYRTLANLLRRGHDLEVQVISQNGCALAQITHATPDRCRTFHEDALSRIVRDAKPGDVVFLAGMRTPRLGGVAEGYELEAVLAQEQSQAARAGRDVALVEARSQLRRLAGAGVQVVIDAPKPVFFAPLYRCADWFNAANPVCQSGFDLDKSDFERLRAPAMTSLALLEEEFDNVHLWDPASALCAQGACSAWREGQPLYFDTDHLTAVANKVLYPAFTEVLAAIWERPHESSRAAELQLGHLP